jgi:hypothetical protein
VHLHLTAVDPPRTTPVRQELAPRSRIKNIARHRFVVHLVVLLGFIGAGIAATWPHATYLAGKLPDTRDAGSYVWGFWWMAHAVLHWQDPWLTTYIAAPVGTQLGLHALMPLPGVVMMPVTLLFGSSASYTSLSIMLPGLVGYAMYRVARLWLPSQIGSLAAGAFFGFSGILTYQTWVHLNLAAGVLFLPMTLEAAIRLRRRPGPGQAAVLGLVLGASILTDQESAILALILAVLALVPWLLPFRAPAKKAATSAPLLSGDHQPPAGDLADDDTEPIPRINGHVGKTDGPSPRPRVRLLRLVTRAARSLTSQVLRLRISWVRWRAAVIVGAAALAVSAPQLIATAHVWAASNAPANLSAPSYLQGMRLPDLFLPSPRVASFGLTIAHAQTSGTFGFIPESLALIGLLLAWRRRNAWLLALLFVGVAVLSLGSGIILKSGIYTPVPKMYGGVEVSKVLPFTWFVQVPGLSGFREPSRIAELGMVAIALLAGYTVNWIRYHARLLLIPVLALGVFEAGLGPPPGAKTMLTSYPALDRPIAADHSGSVVLDVPFGLRGGTGIIGAPFVPQTQVLATADGHPLSDALLSRVPTSTINAIEAEPFYGDLISAQTGRYQFSPAEVLRAAENAAHMHIGWVLLWEWNKHMRAFLVETGFSYDYRADGASVYRADGYANGIMTSPKTR